MASSASEITPLTNESTYRHCDHRFDPEDPGKISRCFVLSEENADVTVTLRSAFGITLKDSNSHWASFEGRSERPIFTDGTVVDYMMIKLESGETLPKKRLIRNEPVSITFLPVEKSSRAWMKLGRVEGMMSLIKPDEREDNDPLHKMELRVTAATPNVDTSTFDKEMVIGLYLNQVRSLQPRNEWPTGVLEGMYEHNISKQERRVEGWISSDCYEEFKKYLVRQSVQETLSRRCCSQT